MRNPTITILPLLAASCGPTLSIAPTSLTFDEPALGVANILILDLQNVGGTKLKDIEITADDPFGVIDAPRDLAAGELHELAVLLETDEEGEYEGFLRIGTAADERGPRTVPVSATVLAPAIELVDRAWCGGGGVAGVIEVDIANAGAGPLVITEVTLTEDGDGAFSDLAAELPLWVPPYHRQSLSLACDGSGELPGLLEIVSNDPSVDVAQVSLEPGALALEVEQPVDGKVWSTEDTQTFTFTPSYPDPAEALYASWTSHEDGAFWADVVMPGEPVSFETVLSNGSHNLELELAAPDGSSVTDHRTVHVSTPPTAAIVRPTPGTEVNQGANWTFSGDVWDPDQDLNTLTVRWRSSLDGDLPLDSLDSKGNTLTEVVSLSVGYHIITLEVEDEHGLEGSATSDFTVNATVR
jgi:hypothetical protein